MSALSRKFAVELVLMPDNIYGHTGWVGVIILAWFPRFWPETTFIPGYQCMPNPSVWPSRACVHTIYTQVLQNWEGGISLPYIQYCGSSVYCRFCGILLNSYRWDWYHTLYITNRLVMWCRWWKMEEVVYCQTLNRRKLADIFNKCGLVFRVCGTLNL